VHSWPRAQGRLARSDDALRDALRPPLVRIGVLEEQRDRLEREVTSRDSHLQELLAERETLLADRESLLADKRRLMHETGQLQGQAVHADARIQALAETVERQRTRARTLQERLEQQRERRRELERLLFDGASRHHGRGV